MPRLMCLAVSAAFLALESCALLAQVAQPAASPIVNACHPVITDFKVVATPEERRTAGNIAQPPLTDTANGFAWPDTPIGVIKLGSSYAFFGSDGGYHARQEWEGHSEGNNKYGSITRSLGTLSKPLGTAPPVDVTIRPNPDPAVNPAYASYDYIGGGPVYKVPQGLPGEGKLLMVYHAEIPTITTQSFYSILALAASSDDGLSWTDLGEIIRLNQAYRTDLDGYDIGDTNIVPSPDGKEFYIYFSDWLANGTTHWNNGVIILPGTLTAISVARAPIASVLTAAFGAKPHAVRFSKRYSGWNYEQGLGGYSTDQNVPSGYVGSLQVRWNTHLHRYQEFINQGVLIAYSESPDGLTWSQPTILYDFRTDPNQPTTYVAPVGLGEDPSLLGQQFDILYTYIPGNGHGWPSNSVRRFTVTCN